MSNDQNNKVTRHCDPSVCIHCDKCKKSCIFLDKYKIDISNTDRLRELAYHCFLCGRCTEVCPKGIDGREIILRMRQEEVSANNDKLVQKGYGFLLFEKKDYIYKNYRKGNKKSVLFPGCNYPSFYPKTTKELSKMLKEVADMGTVYDCCGKPISELGLKKEEERTLNGIYKRMKEQGVEEIVTMCPNCFHYLKPKFRDYNFDLEVKSIYEKFTELGIGHKIKGDFSVFLPCPEREPREMYKHIENFIEGDMFPVNEVQCCGLGGCAIVKEPQLAQDMCDMMKLRTEQVYTYCATCAGNLERRGTKPIKHILNEIIGSDERAAIKNSMLNRVKTKFI